MAKWKHALVIASIGVLGAGAIVPVAAAPPPEAVFAFSAWQQYWDEPVAIGAATRSWTWGAEIGEASDVEVYEGAPGGRRMVRYFDKARMEYHADAPGSFADVDANPWKVTTGLLATELMTGQLQLGDDTFEQHAPAQIPVAGDPDSGDLTPSYADMATVMGYRAIPAGWTITQTIDADGRVGVDQSMAANHVTTTDVGAPTGHTVASVFWQWMTQVGPTDHAPDTPVDLVTERLFANPFYATGYPTTEAYWTRARVAGSETDVLVQCFERRCMTYTPSNAPQWQVEMANIGQHYYHWRYVEIPADTQHP